MRDPGHEQGAQRVAVHVGVVRQHARRCDRERLAGGGRPGVGAGHGGIVHRDHIETDGAGRGAAAPVAGRVGERIRAVVVGLRRVGERAVRRHAERAMGRSAVGGHHEGVAIRVRVVPQHAGSRHREQVVLIRRVAVGSGHGWGVARWALLQQDELRRVGGSFPGVEVHLVRRAGEQPVAIGAVAGNGGGDVDFLPDAGRRRSQARERGAADDGSVVPGDSGLGPGRAGARVVVRDGVAATCVGAAIGDVEPQRGAGQRAGHATHAESKIALVIVLVAVPHQDAAAGPVIVAGPEAAHVGVGHGGEGERQRWRRRDLQRHRRGRGQSTRIRCPVGEAIRTEEIGDRCVGEGAVRVEGQASVRGRGDYGGRERVAVGIGVVAEHPGSGRHQVVVLDHRISVGHRHGGVGPGGDAERHGGDRGSAMPVGRGVGEGVRPVVVGGRGVGERPGGLQSQRAVRGAAGDRGAEGIAVGVAVVAEHARSGQGERGILVQRIRVVPGHGAAVGGGGHLDRDRGVGRQAAGVASLIGEGVRAGEAGGRRVVERAVRIERQAAVPRGRDERGGQGIAVGVAVVGEHAGRGHGKGIVRDHRIGIVGRHGSLVRPGAGHGHRHVVGPRKLGVVGREPDHVGAGRAEAGGRGERGRRGEARRAGTADLAPGVGQSRRVVRHPVVGGLAGQRHRGSQGDALVGPRAHAGSAVVWRLRLPRVAVELEGRRGAGHVQRHGHLHRRRRTAGLDTYAEDLRRAAEGMVVGPGVIVAVDIQDRLAEAGRGRHEWIEERGVVVAGPGLGEEHRRAHAGLLRGELLRGPRGVVLHDPGVVVAAQQVDAHEQHAVLHEREVLLPPGLPLRQRRAAEVILEAQEVLEPELPSRAGARAVDGLVVPGHDVRGDREHMHDVRDALVAELRAALATAEDVPQVDEEVRRAVDVVILDLTLEHRDLRVAVRHVAGRREDDRRVGRERRREREDRGAAGPEERPKARAVAGARRAGAGAMGAGHLRA